MRGLNILKGERNVYFEFPNVGFILRTLFSYYQQFNPIYTTNYIPKQRNSHESMENQPT